MIRPALRATAPLLLGLAAACGAGSAPPGPETDPVAGLEERLQAASSGKGSLDARDLRAALASPLEPHRLKALAYARQHAVPGTEDALGAAARAPGIVEARFAIEALIHAATAAARHQLAALPPPADEVLRRAVCQHLADAADPVAEDALLAYAGDANPEIRQVAARGLGKLAPVRGDALLAKVRRVLAEGVTGARLAALSVLTSFPPDKVRPDLERALVDGPEALAEQAAETLLRIRGNAGLARELATGRPARARVARLLARGGDSELLAPFRDDPDPRVRLAAAYGRGGGGVAAPPPLLLLIVVDTLRADRLSAYGHHEPVSAHVDRLARRGVVRAEARAHAPWTMASHVALFTSRYASELGVHDVADALPGEAETLAEILKSRGYVTAAVTSVPYLTAAYAMDQGFDWIESQTNQSARRVTDRAIPLLRAMRALGGERPAGLFLLVHYFDPHENYQPPAPWLSLLHPAFRGTYEPARRARLTAEEVTHIRAAYDGEVAHVDEEIGRLLAFADRLGFSERDIWFTSDHGEELLDHGRWGHGWTLYEEQSRVPLIEAGGGRVPAVDLAPARLVDVLPSILARAGIAPPGGIRGRPLGPGPAASAYAESRFKGIALASLVEGGRKVVQTSQRAELYDLVADPAESRDLAAEQGDALMAARERLAAEAPVARALVETPAGISPEALESLRALGYIGP